jgi:hypothetical protein
MAPICSNQGAAMVRPISDDRPGSVLSPHQPAQLAAAKGPHFWEPEFLGAVTAVQTAGILCWYTAHQGITRLLSLSTRAPLPPARDRAAPRPLSGARRSASQSP